MRSTDAPGLGSTWRCLSPPCNYTWKWTEPQDDNLYCPRCGCPWREMVADAGLSAGGIRGFNPAWKADKEWT